MAFLYALPGAVAEGLIWGLMAIGVYISYKILDIADLTVDGSICTGGCVCAVLLACGMPVWVCVLAAFLAGALTGVVTGLFHTALGIPAILAGILTQLILYSVNLTILGGKSLAAVDPRASKLLMHMSNNPPAIVIALAAIHIGLSVSLKIKPNFVCSLIGVVCGGVVYYVIYNLVILMGLKTDFLKMLSALIVAVFLAVPYLKAEYFTDKKALHAQTKAARQEGGSGNG